MNDFTEVWIELFRMLNQIAYKCYSTDNGERMKIEWEKLKERSIRKEKKDHKKIDNEHIKEQKRLDNAYTDSLIKQLLTEETNCFEIKCKHGSDVIWKRNRNQKEE